MTTREQRLRELVEKWRNEASSEDFVKNGHLDVTEMYGWKCADELASAIDEDSIVSESDAQKLRDLIIGEGFSGIAVTRCPESTDIVRTALTRYLKEPGQ